MKCQLLTLRNSLLLSVIMLIGLSLVINEVFKYYDGHIKRDLKLNFVAENKNVMKSIDYSKLSLSELKLHHFKALITKEISSFSSLNKSPKFNDLLTKAFLSFALNCQLQKVSSEITPDLPLTTDNAMLVIDAVFEDMKVKVLQQLMNIETECESTTEEKEETLYEL